MDRLADLRADYEQLGRVLAQTSELSASGAAAVARERRIIGVELERLEAGAGEVPLVDQLAARRRKTGAGGSPVRRRKSG